MSELPVQPQIDRAREALDQAGIDIALCSSIANVTYLSGVEVPIPLGAGFELTFGPWLAVLSRSGGGGLVVPIGAAQSAVANGYELFGFDTFNGFTAIRPRESYRTQILAALAQAGATPGSTGTIGVESRSLPMVVGKILRDELPGWKVVNVERAMRQARWIKTPREIAKLRATSRLSDIAHITLAELCREAGRTEFEMYAEISKRIFAAAGRDIPLTGELVTGPRTTTVQYPNGPRERTTEQGDAALMDLSGRFDGYWFDCTTTHVIGGVEPTAEQRRYAHASQAACEAGMAALTPGGKASDAAKAAEAAFASFSLPVAHYTGHQIGVTVNERPRLVQYDDSPIEPGMVFSVEPGAYQGPGGTFGARSEKMVLVTETGPEILSIFSWGI